jgi:hypothetical protein
MVTDGAAGTPGQPVTGSATLPYRAAGWAVLRAVVSVEAARLVVTGQMVVDLVIVGLGIKIILGAVTRGQQQRRRQDARGARSG